MKFSTSCLTSSHYFATQSCIYTKEWLWWREFQSMSVSSHNSQIEHSQKQIDKHPKQSLNHVFSKLWKVVDSFGLFHRRLGRRRGWFHHHCESTNYPIESMLEFFCATMSQVSNYHVVPNLFSFLGCRYRWGRSGFSLLLHVCRNDKVGTKIRRKMRSSLQRCAAYPFQTCMR